VAPPEEMSNPNWALRASGSRARDRIGGGVHCIRFVLASVRPTPTGVGSSLVRTPTPVNAGIWKLHRYSDHLTETYLAIEPDNRNPPT
jgi:hypothetical protein